jgi:hypothetical protein
MKYYKIVETEGGVKKTLCFKADGDRSKSVPEAEGNMDYDAMMAEVLAGTSTIEEVDIDDEY